MPNIAQDRMYQTIDTYIGGTTALYSSGKPLNQSKPNLTIRDFPASGIQLHIHEGLKGTAHLKHVIMNILI